MIEILERIKIAANAGSDAELSRKLEISQQSIAKARTTKTVPFSWLPKVSSLFDVSLDWLYTGQGSARRERVSDPSGGFARSQEYCNDAALIMIPRVSAHVHCGTGSLEADDRATRYAFRAEWLHKKGNAKRMVLMDVTGNSMAPDIKHGDIALVDQDKTDIYGHGLYAISIENVIYIKEIITAPGLLILKSINPRYADINVSLDAAPPSNIRIIGRVLWVGRELD